MISLKRYRMERSLRAQRKRAFKLAVKKYGGYEKVPFRLRERLEREPVIRDTLSSGRKQPWSADQRQLSMAALFGSETTLSIKKMCNIVLRDIVQEMGMTAKSTQKLWKFLKGTRESYGDLFKIARKPPQNRDPSDPRNGSYFILLSNIYGCFRKDLPQDDAHQKAQQFLDLWMKKGGNLLYSPRFDYSHYEKRSRQIKIEPGFERFFEGLRQLKRYVRMYIEDQPNITRPAEYKLPTNLRVMDLAGYKYDISKVKEFVLTDSSGNSLHIVSKRLRPIKSATAEKEFENSKALHRLGIPTPTPIAIIRESGNTYFLWQKLDALDKRQIEQFSFTDSVARQKKVITAQLDQLKIKHRDIEDRNFVVTNENGKPKVWLVDAERIEIPPKLRRSISK